MSATPSSMPEGGPTESVEGTAPPATGRDGGRAPLLNTEAIAAWLGVSHRHVRRLVAERRIPYVKLGHYIRFDCEEIAVWIDEQRVGPPNPQSDAE